jgi:hypothetical protein
MPKMTGAKKLEAKTIVPKLATDEKLDALNTAAPEHKR